MLLRSSKKITDAKSLNLRYEYKKFKSDYPLFFKLYYLDNVLMDVRKCLTMGICNSLITLVIMFLFILFLSFRYNKYKFRTPGIFDVFSLNIKTK